MVSFESLAIGAQFMFDGLVFTKESNLMARSACGQWIADNTFENPFAESEMVVPV